MVESLRSNMKLNRRTFINGMAAGGALSLFNIGCTGFGQGRKAQLASGAKVRIAIVGCGDWGRTLLNREELKIVAEFLAAVRGNPGPVNTGLDVSIPLAKTLMLANMLAFAGKGTYRFDGMKTDSTVANAHARHAYRKGWEIV